MRIERLEVDGFGRFHDATWIFDEGLTVLHGANEAGKTTLLNALRALLFGFEATRDGRTWYPALAGGRRGGRLVVRTRAGERWTVERHGERGGSGALAVRAPNGNQGGQETLDRLLHGADRDLFTNIFAFGLGELQTFASLSADGVRGRIYGAGAGLGGTSAVDLERRLRQQLDGIFLPRGRERPLNQLLARIEELRGRIADLGKQPEEHAEAHRERDALGARAAELRTAVRLERERAARLGRLLDARAPAAEAALLAAELAAGDPGLDRVAADAVAVLDRHQAALTESRDALAALDRELADARVERERVGADPTALEAADAILALRDETLARVGSAARQAELEAAAARHSLAVDEQVARAGATDEVTLVALDDSIPSVERTRELEAALGEARGVLAEAERRERAVAEDVAARERDAAPSESVADIDDRLSAVEALDALRLRRAVAEAGAPSVPGLLLIAAGALLALAAVAFGAAVDQAVVGVVLAAMALAGSVLAASRRQPPLDLTALDDERRALLTRLELSPDADDAAVRAVALELAARGHRAGRSAQERATLEARRAELGRRQEEAAAARDVLASAEAAWRRWLADAGLSDALSPEAARHVLAAAGIARRAVGERDHARAQLAALDDETAATAARAEELAETLGIAPPRDAAALDGFATVVVGRLEAAREAGRLADALDATIERLLARRRAAVAAVEERQAALSAHLAAAGCPDADALRQRARAADERRTRTARHRELRAELAGMAGGADRVDALVAEALEADPAELEVARAEAREQVDRLEDEEREVLNRIGALHARIEQLERAEELGARRQELAVLEGRARALAREWAVRAIALRLLEETRSRYERERQPDVVRAATEHFERITGGRYARIVAPPGEGGVRVETEGGEARATDELSRGTAEQLYLALRFGLIEEFARNAEPLPVVMDDILVNFDADRAARAAAAINDLATRHQVLYFTCHRSAAELLDPDGGRTLVLD